ncbi:ENDOGLUCANASE [Salix viminalis]|uniref:cellulase n=1 Tax=Salix viminalis TaxID=40686 RepID=A0A9Q0TZL8_SALVM|nr:ENDOGLUCANASE [Salix viminalis]
MHGAAGKLPKNNGIPWRGDSGLQDGNGTDFSKSGLAGGYYDAGDNTKFHFPMAFAMTMLSWSVIEYSQKYEAIGEYKHTRDLIKNGALITCYQPSTPVPEKSTKSIARLADLKMAPGSQMIITAGKDLKTWTIRGLPGDLGKRKPYSRGKPFVEPFYNSTGYYDEYIWGATWLYYATGNINYMRWATEPGFSKHSKALYRISDLSVLSWDNKLPAAMLLLTRYRIFLNPGYPYEEMLHMYHNKTELNMCSYLRQFNVFNWTKGGMIRLNSGRPQPLQYVANTAFLASLFVDYLNATRVPGFQCGSKFISLDVLRSFATSQVPFFKIDDKRRYSCTGGWKWRDSPRPNPNNITGAMVGGPDRFDRFRDVRTNGNFTEPTLAGNAGLVAALSSLTGSGGIGIDKNTMFSAVPPLYPPTPPPPPAWKP